MAHPLLQILNASRVTRESQAYNFVDEHLTSAPADPDKYIFELLEEIEKLKAEKSQRAASVAASGGDDSALVTRLRTEKLTLAQELGECRESLQKEAEKNAQLLDNMRRSDEETQKEIEHLKEELRDKEQSFISEYARLQTLLSRGPPPTRDDESAANRADAIEAINENNRLRQEIQKIEIHLGQERRQKQIAEEEIQQLRGDQTTLHRENDTLRQEHDDLSYDILSLQRRIKLLKHHRHAHRTSHSGELHELPPYGTHGKDKIGSLHPETTYDVYKYGEYFPKLYGIEAKQMLFVKHDETFYRLIMDTVLISKVKAIYREMHPFGDLEKSGTTLKYNGSYWRLSYPGGLDTDTIDHPETTSKPDTRVTTEEHVTPQDVNRIAKTVFKEEIVKHDLDLSKMDGKTVYIRTRGEQRMYVWFPSNNQFHELPKLNDNGIGTKMYAHKKILKRTALEGTTPLLIPHGKLEVTTSPRSQWKVISIPTEMGPVEVAAAKRDKDKEVAAAARDEEATAAAEKTSEEDAAEIRKLLDGVAESRKTFKETKRTFDEIDEISGK